jgi:hypothetical protein
MNWFERHLNWSLFFAVILLPLVVSLIFYIVYLSAIGGIIADLAINGLSMGLLEQLITTMLPFVIISFVLGLGILIFDIVATVWYLGRKDRSKGFLLLIIGPCVLSFVSRFFVSEVLLYLSGLAFIVGVIILFLLGNHSTGYGGDFAYETETIGSTDSGYGVYGAYDERQLKELDYTPSQNVLDISGGPPARDVRSMADVPDAGGGGADRGAGEEIPPEKVTPRPATYERPSMPILLDDDGNVIHCAYHPGADAVNLCSRCHQYVCIECNYVTGTHPICRNCWERRTEAPLAPPPQKQARPAPSKPAEKQKVAEPAESVKQEEPAPAGPELPPVAEVAEPVEQIAAEPVEPVEQEAVAAAEAEAEEQPATAVVKPEERPGIAAAKPEEQKIAAPAKPAKLDAETVQWQREFMAIYQQASAIINVIIKKGADGMPGSPLDLMEGLKLRPMLALVKKLSKPKDRELREAKSELEQVLSSCIKIADAAADFVGGGGQALLGGPDFKRIVAGIERSSELMEKLSQRLPAFSRPQE